MKKGFIYSISILIVAFIAIVIAGSIKGSGNVVRSASSVEQNNTWRVALAGYINEQAPGISVDDKVMDEAVKANIVMSDDLELMFTEEGIREAFDCFIELYDNSYYRIDKGEKQIWLYLNTPSMTVDGNEIPLDYTTFEKDGIIYIPEQVLERGFGYFYDWDKATKSAIFKRPEGLGDLPAYFNYMDRGKITYVKNQENNAACWAFAALSAVESTMLPEEYRDFSEDHMIHNNGYNLDPAEGGDYIMTLAYLTSWRGPVLEEDDPYGDDETNAGLEAVNHVQEVRLVEEKDYDTIKKMIFKYGGVESSVYIALLNEYTIDPDFYSDMGSYNYPYESDPNHEVVIIGWDDNYSRYNFMNEPSRDGAFICLNSWGENFGENGIFYVSYDDYNIGSRNEVYTKIEPSDNYDNIYQYDYCGWTGRVGYNKGKAFFANVYESAKDELLEAVGFYSTGPDSTYKVYVDTEPDGENIEITGEALASGKLNEAGYYTIKLDKKIALGKGKKFAVIVEINTPGSTHPVAMEMDPGDGKSTNVSLDGKESYLSGNGNTWEKTQESSNCNVCLKAFTTNKEH